MVDFLLWLIVISSGLSLLSYWYCWSDIQRGRPHIVSLRQITGIMDRNKLDAMLGRHQPGYFYRLRDEQRDKLLASRSFFFYSECAADLLCFMGALKFLTGEGDMQILPWFMLLAGFCQFINFAWSTRMVCKWSHQIREEMHQKDDF